MWHVQGGKAMVRGDNQASSIIWPSSQYVKLLKQTDESCIKYKGLKGLKSISEFCSTEPKNQDRVLYINTLILGIFCSKPLFTKIELETPVSYTGFICLP